MTDLPRKRPTSLGRGLSSLLGDVAPDSGGAAAKGSIQMLPVASIEPHPGQPRRHFDEAALEELAASIRARGVIQPIVVRPNGHRFQIVAGERRWRAAQRARLHEIPAVVRDFTDDETLEVALIENIQRADLNAIEEAQAYGRLVADYGHSQEELGRLVSKSRSHVANLLRLLELPVEVQAMVSAGELSMGHARALITAPDAAALARDVVRRKLSVRETEKLAQQGRQSRPRAATAAGPADADVAALERQLGDLLGIAVTIKHKGSNGAITLSYSTLDQLDMLCQRLTGGAI
jgi:ParB family transcriptional regulator, chromosome partitioning protein